MLTDLIAVAITLHKTFKGSPRSHTAKTCHAPASPQLREGELQKGDRRKKIGERKEAPESNTSD
jgi:hypothetical protein